MATPKGSKRLKESYQILDLLLGELTITHISKVVILTRTGKNLNFTQVLTKDSSLRGVYPEATQTLRFAQGDKCRRASFRMTKPLQLSIARLMGNSQLWRGGWG